MRDTLTIITNFVADLLRASPAPAASLDRSVAAAASAHIAARRALAVAVAEETREISRRDALTAKVSYIEGLAVQAIRVSRDDLALIASETIAALRTEIEASERASSRFAAEVALARREVDSQRHRLADLDRGRRLARVGSALNGAASLAHPGRDHLAEAEAALEQLNADNADARAIREEMAPSADRLIERLSEDGFGHPVKFGAADVMALLRAMAAAPALIETSAEISSLS